MLIIQKTYKAMRTFPQCIYYDLAEKNIGLERRHLLLTLLANKLYYTELVERLILYRYVYELNKSKFQLKNKIKRFGLQRSSVLNFGKINFSCNFIQPIGNILKPTCQNSSEKNTRKIIRDQFNMLRYSCTIPVRHNKKGSIVCLGNN